jgi:hypothetical protein
MSARYSWVRLRVGASEREALYDVVVGVASGGLAGLDQQGLHIAQDKVVKFLVASELPDGYVGLAGEAVAGELHVDLVEAAAGSDQG